MSAHPLYRRVILATLSLTVLVSYGTLAYAFAVLVKPMQTELGWSRGTLSGAYSLALLIAALLAWPAGRWLDRRGPRGLMAFGSLVAVLAVILWSQVQRPWQLYATFALVGLAMALVLYETAFAVIAKWFPWSPRRALTVLTVVGGCAGIVFIPVTNWLVQIEGWRWALGTLAVVLAVGTMLPNALLLRSPPSGSGPDDLTPSDHEVSFGARARASVSAHEAVRGVAFWALTAAVMLSAIVWWALVVHLIPFLLDHGFSSAFAAFAVGLVAAMQIPGRALLLPLGRRMPRPALTVITFVLQAIALLVLLAVASTATVLAFAVLFGATKGLIILLRADLLADFYGPAHYGTIGGISALCIGVAQAGGPLLGGVVHDWAGSYTPVLWLLFGATALAVAAALIAERFAPARVAQRELSSPTALTVGA